MIRGHQQLFQVVRTKVFKHDRIVYGTLFVVFLHTNFPPQGVFPLESDNRGAPFFIAVDRVVHLPQRFSNDINGEVQNRGGATHGKRCLVVSQSRGFRAVECPKPHPHPVPCGVPDLRRKLPPRAPPHSAVGLLLLHRLALLRARSIGGALGCVGAGDHAIEEHLLRVVLVEGEVALPGESLWRGRFGGEIGRR